MKASHPDFNIEIVGVNAVGRESANALITSTRTLPWLQDTAQAHLWESWEVGYRDVRILDPENRLAAIFNVTSQDLGIPENREQIKQLFLSAAKVVDGDEDQLPDAWERVYFGHLNSSWTDDPDADGQNNFSEFGFGTDPSSANAPPARQVQLAALSGALTLEWTVRRPAGWQIEHRATVSPAVDSKLDISPLAPVAEKNLFDGSGTVEVRYQLSVSPEVSAGFLRLFAFPR